MIRRLRALICAYTHSGVEIRLVGAMHPEWGCGYYAFCCEECGRELGREHA